MRVPLLRDSLAIVLLVAAGFATLALLTYHPADPSWSIAGGSEVRNAGGPVGAYLADVLYRFLGLGAYLLVAAVVLQGGRHLLGRWDRRQAAIQWVGTLAVLPAVASLLQLLWPDPYPWLGDTGAGGILGMLLTSFLVPYLNVPGAGLTLAGLLILGLTAASGRSWLEVLETTGRATVGLGRGVNRSLRRTGRALGRAGRRMAGGLRRRPRLYGSPRPPRAVESGPARTPDPGPPADEAVEPAPRVLDEPPALESLEAESVPEEMPDPEAPPASPKQKKKAKKAAGKAAKGTPASPYPAVDLLDATTGGGARNSEEGLDEQARLLEERLADFNVSATVTEYHSGPVVTRFELELAPGTKVSKVTNLAKDLARSLAVQSVRVVENVPGKPVIGLEVPRAKREMVRIREIIESDAFQDAKSPLTLALGTDIAGAPVVTDLGAMPHLLVAGTTGAGKSVGINSMLLSLVYKASAEDVRLILVDPKMLELSVYDGIPHLLAPVVTDMSEAANAFKWCIAEMERRFQLMAHVGVRSLAAYNQRIRDAKEAGDPLRGPSTDGVHEGPELEPQPWIVVVVDELADLMMVAGKQVEESITRLAQKARAAGIHLILATQRPSVDVLTGLIKANIPARISFQVNQRVDSRTILDQGGAEQLLGKGDMLFFPASYSAPRRVHGAFVEDEEVERVVSHLKAVGVPEYDEAVLADPDEGTVVGEEGGAEDAETDPLYDQAVQIVTESRRASISNVQRRLRVGYNRAARLIDAMERSGVVGPQQSNGSREVLAPPPVEG
ncbi:DNA segregation ATPase FtsK/SpoIIIE, S-DNA-T family [Thiohalorhabdus denitrificans]|uniref:DNA translocase FtsK n=1 Tax=Thiohalorhabdus denitrificans TaxID=381306 RepID=A0A1G5DHC3_9GAMM|nr:DNA segregation ATPase FtsK/SpoIIIE, S-DNA-T family [Thiohalorhabdus denitrificans]